MMTHRVLSAHAHIGAAIVFALVLAIRPTPAHAWVEGLAAFFKLLDKTWLGTADKYDKPLAWNGEWPTIRPAAAQVEAVIVSEHAQEFILLPQPRPSDAPILPDAPLIYHKPGYFPQLDVTDRITLSLLPNLPPAEYDHPYQGRLRIIYLDTPQTVDRMCRLAAYGVSILPDKTYLGCAIRSDLVRLDPNADCVIFIMENISRLRDGQTLNGLMRHEIGHCNGWNNHNGIRDASHETPSYVPTKSKKAWVPLSQ
jgi:hypothetical protein